MTDMENCSNLTFSDPVYSADLSDAAVINHQLLQEYLAVNNHPDTHKTHHFMGRFENTYLPVEQLPSLPSIIASIVNCAVKITGVDEDRLQYGFWFNEMHPGHKTSLHTHEENDELLSAVYYITAPKESGDLVVKSLNGDVHHKAVAGRAYFFKPDLPHSVTENLSQTMRLSVAFNFGLKETGDD